MRNDKHIALKLRREGLSYKKISKELEIPLSTLSAWFSGLDWSQTIKLDLAQRANYVARKRLRLINKARREMWERWREEAREEARQEFPKLLKNPLFIAGTMLYWGEGDNKAENGVVRLANTNADMLRMFAYFLTKITKTPEHKIWAAMFLYPDLNEKVCMEFWSEKTGVPTNKFQKTQYIQGRHPTKRLSHGVLQIGVRSRQLKEKILTWINLLQEQHP